MIKAGIVGITGYGGIELYRLLKNHPEVEIAAISSRSGDNKMIYDFFPHTFGDEIKCKNYPVEEIVDICDVIFTAVPHGGPAMEYADEIIKKNKVHIDLSADFRIHDYKVYEKWYKTEHTKRELLNKYVYGLPELHKKEISKTKLIANPGCYTTNAILALSPLIKNNLIDIKSIIVDAKSGTSGAGRGLKQNMHYSELNEGIQAYGVASHRHTPEIEQELSLIGSDEINILFTPHLTPMTRGILTLSYAKAKSEVATGELIKLYKDFYNGEPFVRILDSHLPNTKYVSGSNYIDITVIYDDRTDTIVVISALDNLIKGASGQAVQNMNIIYGFNEVTGLESLPIFP